jgi:phosphoglycerate kinase
MKSIREISILENIPVLVRAPLNMTIVNGKVATKFRLEKFAPTVKYLTDRHARVVLCGHIGDEGTETLAPVFEAMQSLVPNLSFCKVPVGPEARAAVRDLAPGQVLMLENLRRDAGEKSNDPRFAIKLAELADVFVEDCFDTLHREHASIVGVPKLLSSYVGFLVEEEVAQLRKALAPKSPSLAIIGGAKFATKEPVLTRLLDVYDHVYVGGALANDFMKAAGHSIGASLTSEAQEGHMYALLKNPKLLLPRDYVVAPKGASRPQGRIASVDDVKPDEAILDNGPQSVAMIAELLKEAKSVLWNGTLGQYEHGFVEGTEALARVIAGSRCAFGYRRRRHGRRHRRAQSERSVLFRLDGRRRHARIPRERRAPRPCCSLAREASFAFYSPLSFLRCRCPFVHFFVRNGDSGLSPGFFHILEALRMPVRRANNIRLRRLFYFCRNC